MPLNSSLVIGPQQDKESLESLTTSILRIMEAKADQRTIRVALNAFKRGVSMGPTTVTGCTFSGDVTHHHHPAPETENLFAEEAPDAN